MSKTKISNQKLVIQLGRDESVFALCEKGGQILHSIALPTPERAVDDGMIRDADAVRELIQSATAMPEFIGVHNAVFSLCTSQVITETVTTPNLSKKKLEKLILANIDVYFPVDMSEYKVVWEVIGQKQDNSDLKELLVQLWAVPSAMLAAYYAVGNAAGLSVTAIDYCGYSIATALHASFSKPGKQPKERKKLDLNKEITFGRKKKAEAPAEAEEVPVVLTEVTNSNNTQVHFTLDKSLFGLTFVQNRQVVHQRFISTGFDPSYVIHDVAMMVEYFRSLEQGRNSELTGFVSGALCEDIELVSDLSMVLDMPLSVLEAEFAPHLVICAGAANCKLDFGIRELNKPNKELVQKTAQVGQTAALAAGGAALAGVVALTFVARFSWNATIESLEAQRHTLALQAQKVAGYADKYKEYTTLYDNYSSDWNTVFNSLRTYNDNLVRVLDELESILPEKTSVTALAIGADGLNVQFACENKEEAAYLIMQLRELQYANLAAISSLSGGGRGAAKTYGNGEAAPKEGSAELTTEQRNALAELLIEDFDVYKMTAQTSGFSSDDIYAIETNYGNLPSTDIVVTEATELSPEVVVECKTLAQLESHMASQGITISANMRANAMTALLNTNPFAANRLANVVLEISKRGMDAMDEFDNMSYALELYKNKDKIQDRSTPDATKTSLELLTSISTKPANQKDTEKFIKKDAVLEQWYVYYLQEELNKDTELPEEDVNEEELVECEYLALDTMIADLVVEGKFSTSNAALNNKLDAFLSEESRTALGDIIGSMPEVPVTPTPPVEVTPTPDSNISFMGMTLETANQQIEMYITEGYTDYYPLLDEQIGMYLTKGQSDYPDLDTAVDMYISMGMADAHAATLVTEYLNNGKLSNGVLNQLVGDALQKGKTGNAAVDKRIETLMKDAKMLNAAVSLINDYINKETSGYPHLDTMLNSYYTQGSTGSPLLDELVKTHNLAAVRKDIQANKIDTQKLPVMYATFKASGVSGGGRLYDLLFTQLKNTGKTHIGLESLIFPQTNTPSGGGGAGAAQPVDTRIAFTVILGYNNDLMLAELERKGLSNDSKVDKLEVNG